jgi:HK97 family phage major capsid protein
MSKLQTVRDQIANYINEGQRLWEEHTKANTLTPEVAEEIRKLQQKADELKPELEIIAVGERLEKNLEWLNKPNTSFLGQRPVRGEEGNEKADPKAWRELEIKTAWGETVNYRYHIPEAVANKYYSSAFESYMRKGLNGLGPSDSKTLTEGTDTAGGFLVPEDVQTALIKKMATMAVLRSVASVYQTSRDIITFMRVNYASAADDTTGSLFTQPGRVTATGEVPSSSTVHRQTSTVWGQVKIPVNTVMMSELISNDILEDSAIDLGTYIGESFAEAYSLYEENQFINGIGINAPMGLLALVDATNGIESVNSGATTTPFYTYAGVLNIESELPPQYESNARWLGNKATYSFLRQIVTATTNEPLWPVYAAEGGFGPRPGTLLGYPTLRSQFMPGSDTAGNYPLILGDFRGYYIVDRIGLSIQRLTERYAEDNSIAFVARKRFGGDLVKPWMFRVAKIST